MSRTPRQKPGSRAVAAFVGILMAAVVAIGAGVYLHRQPDTALVLATSQDCLRAFDDATCGELVARAMTIHTSSAPRYVDYGICELEFGAGGCEEVRILNTAFFVPRIAVVLVARAAGDDDKALAPLYVRAGGTPANAETRRVYYRGRAVGVLLSRRFGGAGVSSLTDLDGNPFSSAQVHRLRGG